MRKLEGIVKEIDEELGYLKSRESRFRDTNRESIIETLKDSPIDSPGRINKRSCAELRALHPRLPNWSRRLANIPPSLILQAEVPHRLECHALDFLFAWNHERVSCAIKDPSRQSVYFISDCSRLVNTVSGRRDVLFSRVRGYSSRISPLLRPLETFLSLEGVIESQSETVTSTQSLDRNPGVNSDLG
jgi:hypothetical protein